MGLPYSAVKYIYKKNKTDWLLLASTTRNRAIRGCEATKISNNSNSNKTTKTHTTPHNSDDNNNNNNNNDNNNNTCSVLARRSWSYQQHLQRTYPKELIVPTTPATRRRNGAPTSNTKRGQHQGGQHMSMPRLSPYDYGHSC